MRYQESQLLALKTWYTYPQQPQEVAKELTVELNSLLFLLWLFHFACSGLSGSNLSLPSSGFFLLRYRIVHSMYQRDDQSDIDTSGDLRPMLQILICQFLDQLPETAPWREQLRLNRH